jgi:hypothetical protein
MSFINFWSSVVFSIVVYEWNILRKWLIWHIYGWFQWRWRTTANVMSVSMLNPDMKSTTGGHSWTTMAILHDRLSVITPRCSHICGLFIFLICTHWWGGKTWMREYFQNWSLCEIFHSGLKTANDKTDFAINN